MRYISILRGINVGGHKKIKMADLKALYLSIGLTEVVTYIQSGNVIFNTPSLNQDEISTLIADAIKEKYSFDVPVMIRTANAWESIIQKYPFSVNTLKNLTTVLVTLLSDKPTEASVKTLMEYVNTPDYLVIDEKNIYLYTPNGYGKTKLSNNFIEKKLKVKATTRNWKSILKLYELSRGEKDV